MLAVFIVFGLLGLMGLGIAGFFVLIGADRKQKKAEKNADTLLDAAFDGRDGVSVNVTMTGLKYDTYVLGAKQRGYRLLTDGRTNGYGPVVFEKA